MPFHLGGWELLVVLLLVLIIFGVGRLPEVGSAIGKGLREFRKAQTGSDEESSKPKEATEDKS